MPLEKSDPNVLVFFLISISHFIETVGDTTIMKILYQFYKLLSRIFQQN